VVPIAPGRAYALGSWTANSAPIAKGRGLFTTMAFPIAMWLVSMTVALVSIHQLVIHPIRDLGRRMRGFADGRRILHAGSLSNAPGEISEIGDTFETMARRIIRDEADLENTLFEREVLLKEVHHRVKNNLQLMSSILSMQARKARSEEARQSLRDVQERLRSLAAIHRGSTRRPSSVRSSSTSSCGRSRNSSSRSLRNGWPDTSRCSSSRTCASSPTRRRRWPCWRPR
jgi:hypothetical protein